MPVNCVESIFKNIPNNKAAKGEIPLDILKQCGFSDWYDIVRGVPQGLILGPLFFNLFINDLFLFIERTNICNFADDNTIYSCNINLQTILKNRKYDMQNILK